MTKTLLLIGTLALAGIASAKSYDITLNTAATAGGLKMAAGQYAVKVVGNFAVFTNVETGKKYLAAVKAKNAGAKFEDTAVDMKTANGEQEITGVELGGSSTMIQLGE